MIWMVLTSTGSNFVASFYSYFVDKDLSFRVAAGILGIAGAIAVENRVIAENELDNLVASLAKVWGNRWNTEKQSKDRCRELYLVSTLTECLSNALD